MASSLHAVNASSPLVTAVYSGHSTGRASTRRIYFPIEEGLGRCYCDRDARSQSRLSATKKGGVEPDLPEVDFEDVRTLGEPREGEEDTFPYGIADGHHTYHEGQDGPVWDSIKEVFTSAGGPTGGQAYLAWLTFPALIAGIFLKIKVEYLLIALVLFVFAFIGIEMAKPEEDHDFPPKIYMERRKKKLAEEAAAKQTSV